MRADRLIALLLFLQSRGRVTAAEVATELEVSLATARRDLEALGAAGVPIHVQPGRGGGWQLIGDARTNLSGLSGHEATALFWLLGTAGLSSPETRVATMKLIRALPQSLRTNAERLATSIHYDHRRWGEPPAEAAAGLDLFREAIVQRLTVSASYTSRTGEHTTRTLRPVGLVAKSGDWYLVADGNRGVRTYRLARLTDAQITDEPFDPPQGFDLVEYWREHVREVETVRSAVAARLRVPAWIIPILRQQFGRHCTVLSSDEGHALVEVRAHLLTGLAEQLAGWGRRIEVISPAELRTELHRIGTELVAANGRREVADDGMATGSGSHQPDHQ